MRKTKQDNRLVALKIISKLRENGYQAYFVGGCVRDRLLGRENIEEHDIATDAPADAIITLFRKTRKVGVKFGVVLVGISGHWIEVATFRTDESYSDGRHPDKIQPATIEEDAQRRDFTINGIYYDPIENKLIDLVGGQEDIRKRIIRAIGEPHQRFKEDLLRMLRAVRFAAQLSEWNFVIEQSTADAIRQQAEAITSISNERISEELKKILVCKGRVKGITLLADFGLLKYIIPELENLRVNHVDIWQQTLKILDNLPATVSFELAMSALLCKVGLTIADEIESTNCVREKVAIKTLNPSARIANKILRRLTYSNRQREDVVWFVEFLPLFAKPEKLTLADIKRAMMYQRYDGMITLLGACKKAEVIPNNTVRAVEAISSKIDKDSLKQYPFLTGDDLSHLFKLTPGPIYKRILEAVYDAQLNEQITDKPQAIKLAEKIIRHSEQK